MVPLAPALPVLGVLVHDQRARRASSRAVTARTMSRSLRLSLIVRARIRAGRSGSGIRYGAPVRVTQMVSGHRGLEISAML